MSSYVELDCRHSQHPNSQRISYMSMFSNTVFPVTCVALKGNSHIGTWNTDGVSAPCQQTIPLSRDKSGGAHCANYALELKFAQQQPTGCFCAAYIWLKMHGSLTNSAILSNMPKRSFLKCRHAGSAGQGLSGAYAFSLQYLIFEFCHGYWEWICRYHLG